MICSSVISHPHASSGTEWGPEVVMEFELFGYSDVIEYHNNLNEHFI